MPQKELSDKDVFETALTESTPQVAPGEIVLGSLVGIDAKGQALVDFAESPSDHPLAATSTVAVSRQQLNRQVALLFVDGDLSKPVILGFIHSHLYSMLENFDSQRQGDLSHDIVSQEATLHNVMESQVAAERDIGEVAHVDGEEVLIEGKKQVVLKCGDASITLTKAGKIIIRGKYLLSRSSGVNRILGGSVQVN